MECFEVNKLNSREKEKVEDRLNPFPNWIPEWMIRDCHNYKESRFEKYKI